MKRWWLPGVGLVLAVGFGLGWLGRGTVTVAAPTSSGSAPAAEPRSARASTEAVARSLVRSMAATIPAQEPPDTPGSQDAPESQEAAAEDITAEEERGNTIEHLRQSGRDERDLLGTVRSEFEDWKAALSQEPKLDVKLGSWECYRAGCFVDAVHGSIAEVSQSTQLITATRSFLRWNSGKMRSGEITRPDGKVEVTWVLFAPPEGQPVLQPHPSGDED